MVWTKDEIKKLKELYFNTSIDKVIKQLPNRTIQTIRKK